ncbi:MAG: preprotein translocase subunit SecE [Planctomycetota bacterium]|nr:preprotein translocase subunit SecE [Planctomycetota bacterium]
MSGNMTDKNSVGTKSTGLPWEGLVGFVLLAFALYLANMCPAGQDSSGRPLASSLNRDLAWTVCVSGWLAFGIYSARLLPSGVVGRARYFTGGIILGSFVALAMTASGSLDVPGTLDFKYPLIAGIVALPFLAIGMAFYKFIAEPATMKSLDEQGWFGVKAYKPQQGHRIRRATLAALWFLAGSGMYTAYQSGALAPANLAMPFTGYYTVVDAHDSELITPDLMPGVSGIQKGDPLGRSEYSNLLELVRRESVTQANRLITNPDEKSYFGIYREIQFKEAVAPTVRPEGRGQVMLLPSLGTQALVFTVLLVWLSVRLTQVPAFADFLISTDAEMNKVSWASRSKLWQDTIVVIVGMLLMAGLMMGLDQMWRGVLTATSVLQFRSGGDERNRSVEQRTW